MPKRSANNELNHDNWDEEEEPEEIGVFKPASAEVMRKRVIRTGRRRITSGSSPVTSGPSPFSKFTAFGTAKPTEYGAKNFSFLNNLNSSTTTSAPKNGLTVSMEDKKQEDSSSISDSDDKTKTYLSKLRGLNESLNDWIQSCINKNPTCILTPIFSDYEKYLKEIQSERDKKEETPGSGFKFSFLGNTNAPTTVSSSAPSPSASTPSLFSSNTSLMSSPPLIKITEDTNEKPSSIFGSSGGSGSSLFSFKASTGSDKPSFGSSISPFGGGKFTLGGGASSFSSTLKAISNEEEAEEPPKNDFKPVTEEGAIYTQRVKVFVKKKTDFLDRGVGSLYIKEVDSKYQMIVRADTNLGNILLNILLTDALPAQRMGKNNVLLVCVPTPDSEPPPVPTLLRVKTEEEADKLLEKINNCKKQSKT